MKKIKSFGCINWQSHWNSKTWNKKQEGGFLRTLLATSLVQLVISSVVKGIRGREVRGAARRQMDKKI